MNQNTQKPDDFTKNNPDFQEESITDPKTGKKINRKKSMLVAAAGTLAGIGISSAIDNNQLSSVNFDSNLDGQTDTLLSDQNNDGIFETAIPVEPEIEIIEGSPFNAGTAPHATSVNDDMSFSEAFANAREELGPGGVFEWNGQIYGTFYEDEVDEQGNPTIEYETVSNIENTGEVSEEFQTNDISSSTETEAETETEVPVEPETENQPEPYIMGIDSNADGVPEGIFVDINLDGSADAVYADINQDGVIAEDEVQFIHDPENLIAPEQIADGTTMSIDSNQDGTDDTILLDVNDDLSADAIGIDQNADMIIDENEVTILNAEAMPGSNDSMDTSIEYQGEVSTDMPEDVSPDVLDNYSNDTQALEDNFGDINDWA